MLCEYGCNQEAKYTLSNGAKCCSVHRNKCSEIRRKNSESLKKAYKDDKGLSNHKFFSLEARNRMGAVNKGKNKYNCEHIKRKSETTRKNFSEGKWIGSFTGKHHTPETLEKLRYAALKIIEEQCLNGLPFTPSIGKNETECLNELEKISLNKCNRKEDFKKVYFILTKIIKDDGGEGCLAIMLLNYLFIVITNP